MLVRLAKSNSLKPRLPVREDAAGLKEDVVAGRDQPVFHRVPEAVRKGVSHVPDDQLLVVGLRLVELYICRI